MDGVNWEVKEGENWVLFGPNGSGKTTLLKMITGYIRPSSGKIVVLNETIGKTNLPKLRKKIAWVSSSLETLIHPKDPVIEIVIAGKSASTRMWKMPKKPTMEKAYRILSRMNCEHLAELSYESVSQGERKKVLIARSMMLDPKLLILDEPCEGLDIVAREQFLGTVRELAEIGSRPNVVLVTHHVEEITGMYDKILMLKSGKVVKKGFIEENLTSQVLSDIFERNVEIEKRNGRYWAQYHLELNGSKTGQ